MEIILLIALVLIGPYVVSWVRYELDTAGPPSTNPRKPRRVAYYEVPLLVEQGTLDNQVEFLGEITFFRGGDLMLANQFFRRKDYIDYAFPGGHARREKRSDHLTVTTPGPAREVYQFRYKYVWFRGYGWYRVVRRYS